MDTNRNVATETQEPLLRGTLLSRLTTQIEANLQNEQLSVDALAQAVGMSRSNLHRKLQKVAGVSTSQFIREYRLQRGLEILQKEDITASETAYRVGFNSATYFNTSFHKYYGITPGEVKTKTDTEINNLLNSKKATPSEVGVVAKKTTVKRLLYILAASLFIIAVVYFVKGTSSKQQEVFSVTGTDKSIVVLPFKNLTGNADLEYISDGMTDAVTSRLTKITALDKVIPFTSALPYKQSQKSVAQIAQELKVEHLLQGNLQIAGNQIKIKLQLIHGRSNVHIWSEEYTKEWKTDEIFKIQAEVVAAVARNMRTTISESELVAIKEILTKSKAAYSLYLKAEYQRNKANETSYNHAIALYEEAIAIDPDFVEAYVNEARVWSFGGLVWGIFDEKIAWKNAKRLLEKALDLAPNNREIEEELYTGYFFYEWNYKKVEPYYQSMLDDFYYDDTPSINADYAIKTGRYKEAVTAMEHLMVTHPTFGPSFTFKGEALMFLGKPQEALALLDETSSLYSDNWFYLRESARLYYYLGAYDKSRVQLDKLLTQFTDYPPILMWFNAMYALMDGNMKKADTHLAQLHKAYNKGSSGSPAWFIAMFYAVKEDSAKVFEWLQKSYDRHEVEMTWLREEPLLTFVRHDARYKDLYNKAGFTTIGLPIKAAK